MTGWNESRGGNVPSEGLHPSLSQHLGLGSEAPQHPSALWRGLWGSIGEPFAHGIPNLGTVPPFIGVGGRMSYCIDREWQKARSQGS